MPKINVTSKNIKGQINLGEVWKAGPPSDKEIDALPFIDNGDFEIYSRKLELICFEAYQILSRIGTTQMVQSGDMMVCIYTASGELSFASDGAYMHAVSGQIIIKYIISNYKDDPSVGIKDGDLFIVNEPLLGCIHNPDMLMLMPIFHDVELIAWTVAAVHEGDTGSIDPGGMAPRARTRYDEGLKISPIKIGENFELKKDIVYLLGNFVRNPQQMIIDPARATSCRRVRKNFDEVVEKRKPFL